MVIFSFFSLLGWELRRSIRQKSSIIMLAALLLAGFTSVAFGVHFWQTQQHEIAELAGQYETQMQRLSHRYAQGEEAGYWAYYTFYPTYQQASPLAALAFGVRDTVPMVTWVRLLGLEAQLYESGLHNPNLQALGAFDLAFVFGLLAPCVLLLMAHDALSRDAARGTLPLLAAQAGGLLHLLIARVLAALILVTTVCTLVWALAHVWPGLPLAFSADSLFWFGSVIAYLVFWAVISSLIASFGRTPGASLSAAMACWVSFMVLLPALMNLTISTLFPVPEGLELTVRQRQTMHQGWDQPRQANFDLFLKNRPEWPFSRTVIEKFSWTWYYAMQEVADRSVAEVAQAYSANLQHRRDWTKRLAWVVPPVILQLRLSGQAGTDLESHIIHLQRVRAYHEQLKQHFFPLITSDQKLLPADTLKFPVFSETKPPVTLVPPLTPLLLLSLICLPFIRPKRLLPH